MLTMLEVKTQDIPNMHKFDNNRSGSLEDHLSNKSLHRRVQTTYDKWQTDKQKQETGGFVFQGS